MKVTIGIPFYNNEKTLLNAIRSVFAQSYSEWELILVDDGSSDSSYEIASRVKDPRIRLLPRDHSRRGLIYRLNQIAQEAHGEYLARMDADDLMFPNRIERQLDYLERNPKIDVVGAGMCAVGVGYVPLGIRGIDFLNIHLRTVLKRGLFIHVSIMGRTKWFRSNPYNNNFLRAEDHELWCRTVRSSIFGKITEPLMFVTEFESFDLKKYYQSQSTERKVFTAYGPSMASRLYTQYLIWQSYVKSGVYTVFTFFRIPACLIKKRNSALSKRQYESYKALIANILAIPVKDTISLSQKGHPAARKQR